jgi:hypothetical protein
VGHAGIRLDLIDLNQKIHSKIDDRLQRPLVADFPDVSLMAYG